MQDTKNVFITSDIVVDNERMQSEYGNGFEGFELTESLDDFLEFVVSYSKRRTEQHIKEAEALQARAEKEGFAAIVSDVREWVGDEAQQDVYDEWRNGASYEEQYSTPMMNALRYFPDFVSFDDADRYNVSSNTCLLYDGERGAWAVGMTGGGMDLSPHLLDTFVRLGKGVPLELAEGIRANYNAYVSRETHAENCRLLAQAFMLLGMRNMRRAMELDPAIEKDDAINRHVKALEKKV